MLQNSGYLNRKLVLLFFLTPLLGYGQTRKMMDTLAYHDGSAYGYTAIESAGELHFDVCDSSMAHYFLNKPSVPLKNKSVEQAVQLESIRLGESYNPTQVYVMDKYLIGGKKYCILYLEMDNFTGCLLLTDLDKVSIILSSAGLTKNSSTTYSANHFFTKRTIYFTKESFACKQVVIDQYDRKWVKGTAIEKCTADCIFRETFIRVPDIYVIDLFKQLEKNKEK